MIVLCSVTEDFLQTLFETIQHWKCLYEKEHEKLMKAQNDRKSNDEVIRVCFLFLFNLSFISPRAIFLFGRFGFLTFDTTNISCALRVFKEEQSWSCFQ